MAKGENGIADAGARDMSGEEQQVFVEICSGRFGYPLAVTEIDSKLRLML